MRIFLLGATPSLDLDRTVDASERLRLTGGNSGNQVIAHGLLKTFEYEHVAWDYSVGPKHVADNYDMIVIAAANFLFPNFDFGGMAQFIEAVNLPVTIVGLGAQANEYSFDIPLKPGTERLIRVLADRCRVIGVRGAFTAEVLGRKGVHNVQITGCPSYYMKGPAGLQVHRPTLPPSPRIAVNASRDVTRHSFDGKQMDASVRWLIGEAVAHDGIFIAQSEVDEITLADYPSSEQAAAALNRLMTVFAGTADPERLHTWLLSRIKVFWSVTDWLAAMRSVDFVVGTRFHGGMVALQEGVPSLVICHDTRTTEMCEFFRMPHLRLMDFEPDLKRLYDLVDPTSVSERYRELLPKYQDFLRANGLTPAL